VQATPFGNALKDNIRLEQEKVTFREVRFTGSIDPETSVAQDTFRFARFQAGFANWHVIQ
jgi:hypothetical protein